MVCDRRNEQINAFLSMCKRHDRLTLVLNVTEEKSAGPAGLLFAGLVSGVVNDGPQWAGGLENQSEDSDANI